MCQIEFEEVLLMHKAYYLKARGHVYFQREEQILQKLRDMEN